ncbi:hypothetical protein [Kitasatospora sp. McL0602]|uniref:hypothetical protein n=1 Tax=Kitasatospora sp. McL0602 TaxID=3439530 RepID=UPI003F8B68AD
MATIPLDLLDRIRALEDQVRQLSGRVNIRPAMNQILSGSVVVGEGGTFEVNDADGSPQFYVGGISPAHPDGSPQRGVVAWREDGSIALSLVSFNANPQALAIYDRAGNTLLADDTTAAGLARPYLEASGWFGAVEQPAFVTSNTSFATVTLSPWYKQHPKVQAFFLVRCSDSTTSGEIQLTDDAGTPISSVIPVSAGSFFYGSITGPIAGAHESQTYLRWQARVVPGSTGTIGVKGLSTYGVQS